MSHISGGTQLPETLENLNEIPGAAWVQRDAEAMEAWWRSAGPERLVWHCAARYLGVGTAREDVEEAWLDFYRQILPRAREAFRPGGPDFVTFALNICFKRHCILAGSRIRRRREREVPLEDGDTAELVGTDDPRGEAEYRAFRAALETALASPDMPEVQRKAFRLRHFAGMAYSEIAISMQAPEGSVKAWVHRATSRIATVLRREGWMA